MNTEIQTAREILPPPRFAVEPSMAGKVAEKFRPLQGLAPRTAWADLRRLGKDREHAERRDAILQALRPARFDAVLVEPEGVSSVPEGLRKAVLVRGTPTVAQVDQLNAQADAIVLEPSVISGAWFLEHRGRLQRKVGAYVHVVDPATLDLAVAMTRQVPLLIVEFQDETKIPLEIVLADAQNHGCEVVMKVKDSWEAEVVFGVLECGASGVVIDPESVTELYRLKEVVQAGGVTSRHEVMELTVVKTRHVGMGDRACLDFTSYLGLDEGILIGSFSAGFILACSETHPLPYMPTRPFRVNAGSLQMYAVAPDNRTWYLSDLRSGMDLLAVSTSGKARRVTVGRVKIERRPMLYIEAQGPDGTIATSIMQEDWHVRVFGNDGQPRNVTRLLPGDRIFGYTMEPGRHVGVKVNELIIEL